MRARGFVIAESAGKTMACTEHSLGFLIKMQKLKIQKISDGMRHPQTSKEGSAKCVAHRLCGRKKKARTHFSFPVLLMEKLV